MPVVRRINCKIVIVHSAGGVINEYTFAGCTAHIMYCDCINHSLFYFYLFSKAGLLYAHLPPLGI